MKSNTITKRAIELFNRCIDKGLSVDASVYIVFMVYYTPPAWKGYESKLQQIKELYDTI